MKDLSFENTEIAFKYKSKPELRKAYWLFKLIGSNILVKIGGAMSKFALRTGIPVNWIVKPTIYSHFVGGESIGECRGIVRMLAGYNVKGILDYSVEGTEDEEDFESALQETLRTIENAAKEENIPFAVFKPTAFANSEALKKASAGDPLNNDEQRQADDFRKRVEMLCTRGSELGVRVLIDAEDVCYQAYIDEVVTEMMEKFNKEKALVFNTYQMYRVDRLHFLREAHKKAVRDGYFMGAKFVRGAYMERERKRAREQGYPDPIHPDKPCTDRDYNDALKFSVENIDRISIFNGTHNEYSSTYLTRLIAEKGLAKDDDRIWFSQLYGMSDHISFNLAHHGYNVAKYIPYGPVKAVMPYLIRRTEENTSISGQTSRELMLILKEKNRRKSK